MATDSTLEFRRVASGLAGAEGPVFSRDGKFYMVAPLAKGEDPPGGNIVQIDLNTGKVSKTSKANRPIPWVGGG